MLLIGPDEAAAAEAKIPPLTPRTRQRMSQAVLDTFKSFDKEQQRLGIPKGETLHDVLPCRTFFVWVYVLVLTRFVHVHDCYMQNKGYILSY